MGKKVKTGKARKDKFYKLAKETGYRARSAFKLLQLNRKYEFLQKSRVCIDLCAAPGGWLQVAAHHMPMSSLIVGVDLVPIKTIHNVSTFQEDITTDKCRQTLRKELQTWKADVVLHDGAPNVGQNWLHDAFMQAQLTLQALKLATDFLKKGGWFVTKVFRSKDYHALLWVFGQLFKKVHATKPQASRNESAEIFVVCQSYVAPDKLDPRFLDPKHVFKEVAPEKPSLNLIHPEKKKKKAEGYADGDYTLHHKIKISELIEAENHLELLANCHEIELDNPKLANHPVTTNEIKECCKDIKVLGKKELRMLINWRKKLKEAMAPKEEKKTEDAEMKEEEEAESEDEAAKIQEQLADMADEEKRAMKKKRRKVMAEKRKLRDKMGLGMVIPGDQRDLSDDIDLFNLKKIKSKHGLDKVESQEMESASEDEEDSDAELNKKKRVSYERYEDEGGDDYIDHKGDDDAGDGEAGSDAEESDLEMESEDDAEDAQDSNPLVVSLETKDSQSNRKTDMWFGKDAFQGLEADEDEDLELAKMAEAYREKGGVVIDKSKSDRKKAKKRKQEAVEEDFDSGHVSESSDSDPDENVDSDTASDSDSDASDYDVDTVLAKSKQEKQTSKQQQQQQGKDGFEIVPVGQSRGKIRKLDPLELALGEELVKSKKRRREMVEMSFNRYTFNDDNLPDWFTKDENKHNKIQLPVTKEQIRDYKDQKKAIDARPIKKLAESKARKQRKMERRLEKARKKAEVISENTEVTDQEKNQQMKQVYKRAGLLGKKKPEVAYVVAKKGVGKRVRRPQGIKGPFKVVDPRMRKDMRNTKMQAKQKGKKGKSKTQPKPKGINRQSKATKKK